MGVKCVMRYFKEALNFELNFSVEESIPLLTWYSDACWAVEVNTHKSTSWYVFKIQNATVSWSSRKQSTVTTSSAEAEYLALS